MLHCYLPTGILTTILSKLVLVQKVLRWMPPLLLMLLMLFVQRLQSGQYQYEFMLRHLPVLMPLLQYD